MGDWLNQWMTMSKTLLCSFEQAQVLKRLGFATKCYRYYIRNRLSPKVNYQNHNDTRIATSAPEVTTAAAFLREELGVDLVVSPRFNSKTGDRIGYFWRWSQRTDVIDNKTYQTFDTALSAGISKVLEPFKEYYQKNENS